MPRPRLIAVCGTSQASAEEEHIAEEIGRLIAERGDIVVCGGLGGVMAAVARGCAAAGGTSLGFLPGLDATEAAPDLSIAVPTGMGEMRNALIVRSSPVMITIGAGYGTLSEIGFALRLGKPVVAVHSWDFRAPGAAEMDTAVHRVETAAEAVEWVYGRI